jgi:streptomycin 6-kinase
MNLVQSGSTAILCVMHDPIPAAFSLTITGVFDAEGVAWLQRLPALVAEYERRWSLTVLPPFDLSYSYVAPAIRPDGTAVVLKLGVPNPELTTEIAAMRLYDGHGATRLLDADPERGFLLLERLIPGTPLVEVEDDEAATAIAAEVMRKLWRPVPAEHPFPDVRRWAQELYTLRERFDGATGPLPPRLVDMAVRLHDELSASSAAPVVLHADLHHWNILAAERQPRLALDPKGVIGEPAYETGALLRNPIPDIAAMPDAPPVLGRRIDQLAEMLGFARQRLIGWGIAQAVLSACWTSRIACSAGRGGLGWRMSWPTCRERLDRGATRRLIFFLGAHERLPQSSLSGRTGLLDHFQAAYARCAGDDAARQYRALGEAHVSAELVFSRRPGRTRREPGAGRAARGL